MFSLNRRTSKKVLKGEKPRLSPEEAEYSFMKSVAEKAIAALQIKGWIHLYGNDKKPDKITFKLPGFEYGANAALREKVIPALNKAFRENDVHFSAEPGLGLFDGTNNVLDINLKKLG